MHLAKYPVIAYISMELLCTTCFMLRVMGLVPRLLDFSFLRILIVCFVLFNVVFCLDFKGSNL